MRLANVACAGVSQGPRRLRALVAVPCMRGVLSMVGALGLAAPMAHAQGGHQHADDEAAEHVPAPRLVIPPPGWVLDQDQSLARARALGALPHFGAERSMTSAEVWVKSPAGGPAQVALVISRLVGTARLNGPAEVEAAALAMRREYARSAVNATTLTTTQAAPTSLAVAVEVSADEALLFAAPVQNARYASALAMARGEGLLEAVMGECLAGEAADATAFAACQAALKSLTPSVAVTKRESLAAHVPALQRDTALDATNAEPLTAASNATPTTTPATMTAPPANGPRPQFAPIAVPQRQPTNWKPYLVGTGFVLCLVALVLNRRHRAKIEAEDGRPIRSKRGAA